MVALHTNNGNSSNHTYGNSRITGARLDRPCPVCGKKKDCRANDDGLHFCRSGLNGQRDGQAGFEFIENSRCGTWGMYRIAGSEWKGGVPVASPAPTPAIDPAAAERERLAREAKAASDAREAIFAARRKAIVLNNISTCHPESLDFLARTLKLPRFCLDALRIDMWQHPAHDEKWAWVFYETLPGTPPPTPTVSLRHENGDKYAYGPRGIFVGRNWNATDAAGNSVGPLYIVEGASDVLALYALGLPAIGRPNNTGGAEHIAAFVTENGIQPGRPIIVLGENDQKRNGTWPGMDGARRVSAKLAELLPGHPVTMAFPPDNIKDSRQWVINQVGASWSQETLADLGGVFARAVNGMARKPFDDHPAEAVDASPTPAPDSPASSSIIELLTNIGELAEFVAAARRRQVDHVARAGNYSDPHPEAHTLEFCPRCRNVAAKHRLRAIFAIFQAPCRKLDCPWCNGVKKLQYKATTREHLTEHARAGGDLYQFRCDAEQWPRIYDKINRDGGKYMRFEPAGNRQFIVISTVPPRDVEYIKIEAKNVEQAIDYLARIIDTIPLIDYKPFSSSRAWKLVGNGPPGKQKMWQRLGKVTTDIETAQTVMELKTGEPVKFVVHERRFWPVRSMQCSTLRYSAETLYQQINSGDELPDCDVWWGGRGGDHAADAAIRSHQEEEYAFPVDFSP